MKTYLFAALISLATVFAGGTAFAAEEKGSRLSLTGEGKVSVAPDVGYINFGVVTSAVTATDALTENEKAMKKVFDSLAALGLTKKEIQTSNFSLSRKYEYKKDHEPKEVGYTVSNTVNVTVCDLTKMGKVLDTVVKDGANRVNHVLFGVKNSQELLDKARKQAIADVLRKAKLYAEGGEFRLVQIVSLTESEGGYRPRVFYAAAASERAPRGGDVSVSGGEVNLTVHVSVVWEIAPRTAWNKRNQCGDCLKKK